MPSQFFHHEYSPGTALVDWVECFWIGATAGTERTPVSHRIIPDGCMDVIFDFSPDAKRRVSVIGTMTRPLVFETNKRVDLLGIRFLPGRLPRQVSVDASELTDARADIDGFKNPFSSELWERLAECENHRRVALLREALALSTGRRRPRVDPYVSHCVDRIQETGGRVPVSRMGMEKSTGLSARQLERKFARDLGVSIKTFARVVRFQRASEYAEACRGSVDWARLAGDFGYSDQPHLVREFRALSGLTPGDYIAGFRDVGFLQDEDAAMR